ncbi:MAG: magnesium transporter, partial [Bryobacteraceae bacterium]
MPEENTATGLTIEAWRQLSATERVEAFKQLPPGEDDEFFLNLPVREQAEVLLALPELERRLWVRLLAPDDVADLIQVVPVEHRQTLLRYLDTLTQREVSVLLAYAEDEAGGLMSTRYARLRPDMSIDEAILYLRRQASHVETVYYAYVLDQQQHLSGVVSFRELFSADHNKRVEDVMRKRFITVGEETDQEEVARIFEEHGLLAVPVVNEDGRMMGLVTIDDVVDVVEEEASEDIQRLGGMEALDAPYMQTKFRQLVQKRAGWLTVLFIGEMFTATAMGHYEEEIARAVVLALFIPLIISSGGNSGSQATTLVIRAMAL